MARFAEEEMLSGEARKVTSWQFRALNTIQNEGEKPFLGSHLLLGDGAHLLVLLLVKCMLLLESIFLPIVKVAHVGVINVCL
jgi:hypothetical protein